MIKLPLFMSDNRRLFSSFYWVFIFVLLFFLHSSHQLNADDGVILNGAWNMVNGRRLYLDFFSFIPPAGFYLVYTVWQIFGVSFWSAQIASIIVFFLATVGIYKISQEVYPSKYNYYLPPLFALLTPWFWLINHNVYNFACLVGAVYFAVRGLAKGALKDFVGAGLMTGLSILFLQQRGVALLGAVNIFLLILATKKRISGKILLIYDLCALLPLLFLLFWPGHLLYSNLVDFPLFHYLESNRISYILFFFFLLSLLVTSWVLRREKRTEIHFLLFIQLCLLLSTLALPDFYHIFLIFFPSLVLIPLVYKEISASRSGRLRYYLVFIVICLVMIYYSLLGTIKLCLDVFPGEFISTIKNACADPYLYVGPFMPGLYFESGKLSATPFDILITGQQTESQFVLARKFLESRRPECAILIFPQSLKRFHYNQDNPVDSYIRDNYLLTNYNTNLQDVYVYKRKK